MNAHRIRLQTVLHVLLVYWIPNFDNYVYSQAFPSGMLLRQKITQLECTSPQTIYGLVATERVAKNPKIKEI
jgi:hypothetical protein